MKKITNKRAFFSIISFLVIGLAAGFLMIYTTYFAMPEESLGGMSFSSVLLISTLQIGFFYGLCLGAIGYLQAGKVGLNKGVFFEKSPVNTKAVAVSLGLSLTTVAIMVFLEKLVFIDQIPLLAYSYSNRISPLSLLATVVYGGMLEEIMLRLFLLTIVCRGFGIILRKKGEQPSWVYYTAIVISALIFAAGHLPATNAAFGLNTVIIIRCMVLNSVAGLACGWLYYKYGLEYAMLCHIFFHLFLHLAFIPLFF